MTFRGNLLFGVKRLGLFLAFCLALGLIWAEAKPSAQMAVFQSGTNYDIKYPLGWKVFEGSNKGPDWLDESLAEQGDPQKSAAYTKFILNRVDSLYIRAAFFENDTADFPAFIALSTGGRFGPNDEIRLRKNFNDLFLPDAYVVSNFEADAEGFNSMERFVIKASMAAPDAGTEIHFRSISINGNYRSYTFTLGGSQDDVLRLTPSLEAMVGSLDEIHPREKGLTGMHRGLEIILLITFALMITWLGQKLLGQSFALYRSRRSRGHLGFFPLFIIVLAVMVGFSFLLVTCQNRKSINPGGTGITERSWK